MNPSLVAAAGAGVAGGLLITVLLSRLRPGRRPGGVDAAILFCAGLTTLALAVIAAAISYDHLRILAEQHGERGWRTHAFPLSVDGMEIIATLVLLADRRAQRRSSPLTWTVLVGGFLASLFANMAVAPPNVIARAIAAWPSVALIAAIKLLAGLLEHAPAVAHAQPSAGTSTRGAQVDPAGVAGQPDRQPETSSVPLPVDVLRRIPANQADYDRWRTLWTQMREQPDMGNKQFADTHGISTRQAQWIRAVGPTGLLDSPIPPAQRLAQLAQADGHQPLHPASAP